jgi:hypothetical protein
MKITRGQLRALVDRTEGFVDELECELEAHTVKSGARSGEESGIVVLKFHHLEIEALRDGRYLVTDTRSGEPLVEGRIEPQTNEGWFSADRFRRP